MRHAWAAANSIYGTAKGLLGVIWLSDAKKYAKPFAFIGLAYFFVKMSAEPIIKQKLSCQD